MSERRLQLPLRLVVVGHTNVGKTSLIRTLTRDTGFGEVSPSPGTTRHVEAGVLLARSKPVVRLLDTPGFEDSISLLELIEQLSAGRQRLGVDQLSDFLRSPQASGEFSQEAKIIRQLLECDAVIYVVDAREPVLGKYQDELRILALCGKPVFPLLNFVALARTREAEWRDLLAKLNLHAVVAFDFVVYDFDAEQRLYRKMQTLLESAHQPLEELIQERAGRWRELRQQSARRIAKLLLQTAAVRQSMRDIEKLAAFEQLQSQVRRLEQQAAADVLELFQFRPDDYGADLLPVQQGFWKRDLFDRETLKLFGITAGGTAAKGAAVGLGIDLAVGGVSLGAAAAVGALLGGLWQAGRQFGRDLMGLVSGERYLCIDDPTLLLIWRRAYALLVALEHRGHGAVAPLKSQDSEKHMAETELMSALKTARQHPDWIAEPDDMDPRSARNRQIDRLQAIILRICENGEASRP